MTCPPFLSARSMRLGAFDAVRSQVALGQCVLLIELLSYLDSSRRKTIPRAARDPWDREPGGRAWRQPGGIVAGRGVPDCGCSPASAATDTTEQRTVKLYLLNAKELGFLLIEGIGGA